MAIEIRHPKLREALKALVATPGFSDVVSLVIARDADENPKGAFQSVQDSLKSVGLPSPAGPFELYGREPQVMVITKGDRRIILPFTSSILAVLPGTSGRLPKASA